MQCFDPSTSGEVSWQGEYFGCYFSESKHSPGTCLSRHTHRLATMNFVLSGRYCESLTATSGVADKDEILYKPPHEPHVNQFGSNAATCLLLEFTEPRFFDLAEHLPWLNRTVQTTSTQIKFAAKNLHRELRSNRPVRPLAVESRLLDLLLSIDDTTRHTAIKAPIWLQNIEQYLRDNWQENLSFDEISSEFDVHATHIAREFKRYFGKTAGEFVRDLRLERAAELLANSSKPLPQVALHCGFSDQSHFCRWFKKKYAVTPLQYRKSTLS